MAWSVSWDGSAMTIVVALKLSGHSRNITQWLSATQRPNGGWSPLVVQRTTGNYHPLSANECRALYRAAQKEMRRAISEIAQGAQSSL